MNWEKIQAYLQNPGVAADELKRKLDLGYAVNPMAARNELIGAGNAMPSQDEIQGQQNKMATQKFVSKAEDVAKDLPSMMSGSVNLKPNLGRAGGVLENTNPSQYKNSIKMMDDLANSKLNSNPAEAMQAAVAAEKMGAAQNANKIHTQIAPEHFEQLMKLLGNK